MKTIVLVFSVASAFFRLLPLASAAAGDLDPSFAGTGQLQIGFGRTDDHGRGVALQPDGKVVMAGTSSGRLVLARFGANNVLDSTFGSGGVAYATLPSAPEITGVAVQSDGKIVVAGWIYGSAASQEDFLLAQFNPDGTPDLSFASGGVAIRSYGHRDQCRALMLQSDGKIVVAGTTQTPYPETRTTMVISRFLPDGSPDTSFDGNGSLVETNSSWAFLLAQQPDGKILYSGHLGSTSGVFRLNVDGTRDTGFGTGGHINLHTAPALAIQPGDGSLARPDRIVAAATASAPGQQGVRVWRVSLNGTLDTSFNSTGSVFKAVGSNVVVTGLSGGFINRFLRQIIVTGHHKNGASQDFMLVRFTDAGAVDTAFGNGGIVSQSLTDNNDEAFDMLIQPGPRVLLAGTSRITPDNHDFALARFNWNNGSLDTNFHGTGLLLQNIGDRPASGKCVAVQGDGKIVAAGLCEIAQSRKAVALCRLHPDGTLDDNFGEAGRVVTPVGSESSEATALAIQPDGKIVVAGMVSQYGYDGYNADGILIARYLSNGALDASFGSNGVVVTVTGTNGSSAMALALQPDGKIVVGGRIRSSDDMDFLVMRYHPDGSLDSTWNGAGKVITGVGPSEDELNAILIQPDGKIIAAGGSAFLATGKFSAVRYQSNGALDMSFGTFGRVATQLGNAIYDVAYAALIEPGGKIVLGGFTASPPQYNFDIALLRYNVNGAVDGTFDGDGYVTTPIGLAHDQAVRLARQTDGKIVAACRTEMGSHERFGAVRFSPTGPLDATFGVGGANFYDFGTGGTEILHDMALDARNRMVMIGEVNGRFGILRVQGDPILRLNSITALPNGHLLLTGEGIPGATHTLQKSATLAPNAFAYLAPITPGVSGQWQYEDPNPSGATASFYRLFYP